MSDGDPTHTPLDESADPSNGVLDDIRRTLRFAKFDRHELAGSLGDLGTFLPLLVGMAATNQLNFATALFFAGFFNIATGLLFSIPIAVQPMKAIAAVALTEGLSAGEITAAGAIVGAVVLLLGLTRLIELINRWIPKPAVRGLQLALGLKLLIKGIDLVRASDGLWALDGYLTAAIGAILVLVLAGSKRFPAALALFGGGLLILVINNPASVGQFRLGFTLPSFNLPTSGEFESSFWKAAVPQLPLTTLNSVVAVCALSFDLFPKRGATVRRMSISVGLMNLVGMWFGAMPMCHGAGGLAAQYRFGARTNGAILMLGGVKMGIAVLLGASLIAACAAFPLSILGVMLAFSGIELGLVARDQTVRRDALIMVLTAGAILATGTAVGLAIGIGGAIVIGVTERAGLATDGNQT